MNYIQHINGVPVYLDNNLTKQNRNHRKRRINKKWLKRYGCSPIKEMFIANDGNTKMIIMHPELWRHVQNELTTRS